MKWKNFYVDELHCTPPDELEKISVSHRLQNLEAILNFYSLKINKKREHFKRRSVFFSSS